MSLSAISSLVTRQSCTPKIDTLPLTTFIRCVGRRRHHHRNWSWHCTPRNTHTHTTFIYYTIFNYCHDKFWPYMWSTITVNSIYLHFSRILYTATNKVQLDWTKVQKKCYRFYFDFFIITKYLYLKIFMNTWHALQLYVSSSTYVVRVRCRWHGSTSCIFRPLIERTRCFTWSFLRDSFLNDFAYVLCVKCE